MTTHKLKNAWQLFRESVVGNKEISYTEGSIARVTLLLAIPMILEMAMESVFAVVDIFLVPAWPSFRHSMVPVTP